MFGKKRYEGINGLLNQAFAEKKALIAIHRGVWGGNVVENTILSYELARSMGADMFECDVSMSADGYLYAFHDGNEARILQAGRNIKMLSSAEIDQLICLNSLGMPSCFPVERFETIVSHFRNGELYNVDRAWDCMPQTVEVLTQYPWAQRQALLKSPMMDSVLDFLNECPQKYMYMPIVYSMAEVEKALSYPDINLVGMELIAATQEDALFQDENIRRIRDKGLFVWVNTITLSGLPKSRLFGGLDDDTALRGNKDATWGRLLEKGIDILQTDWPYQLKEYRDVYFKLK